MLTVSLLINSKLSNFQLTIIINKCKFKIILLADDFNLGLVYPSHHLPSAESLIIHHNFN